MALLIKTKFMTVQPPPKVSYTLHDAEADGVSTARVIRVSAVSLCHALVEFFPYDRVYDRRERMVCGATRQVEWDDLCLLTTYSPNNGITMASINRRVAWDKETLIFAKAADRPLVWIADLNVTLHDADVTQPQWFREQAGNRRGADGDRGVAGFTKNEQLRFGTLLAAGSRLVRHLSTHYSNLSP